MTCGPTVMQLAPQKAAAMSPESGNHANTVDICSTAPVPMAPPEVEAVLGVGQSGKRGASVPAAFQEDPPAAEGGGVASVAKDPGELLPK
eukprot:7046489-Pyramimonas_sp.AAC.1